MEEEKTCPICSREIAQPANLHHLLPISRGGAGTPTVLLHQVCHSKIHSLFSEKELARNYNTIEKILANEDIQQFVRFIRKQPPTYYDKNKRSKNKGGRR